MPNLSTTRLTSVSVSLSSSCFGGSFLPCLPVHLYILSVSDSHCDFVLITQLLFLIASYISSYTYLC